MNMVKLANLTKFRQSSRFRRMMSEREGCDEAANLAKTANMAKLANLMKFRQSSRFRRMSEREGPTKGTNLAKTHGEYGKIREFDEMTSELKIS